MALSVLLLTLSLSYSHFKSFFTIKSLLFQVVFKHSSLAPSAFEMEVFTKEYDEQS